jgi:hypothetical protein
LFILPFPRAYVNQPHEIEEWGEKKKKRKRKLMVNSRKDGREINEIIHNNETS